MEQVQEESHVWESLFWDVSLQAVCRKGVRPLGGLGPGDVLCLWLTQLCSPPTRWPSGSQLSPKWLPAVKRVDPDSWPPSRQASPLTGQSIAEV